MKHLLLLTSLLLFISSCGQADFAGYSPKTEIASNADMAMPEEAKAIQSATPSNSPAKAPLTHIERRIIYNAQLNLIVEDFTAFEQKIKALVGTANGYTDNYNSNSVNHSVRSGTWKLRIPVDEFDRFISQLETLGIPQSKHIDSKDITAEYVDLEARLKNKRVLETRISDLIAKTTQIKQVIELERELSRIREDIERIQGRLRYLGNLSSLSTITVYASEQDEYMPAQLTFGGEVNNTFSSSINNMQSLGESLILLIVALVPWLLVLFVLSLPIVFILKRLWKRFREQRQTVNA